MGYILNRLRHTGPSSTVDIPCDFDDRTDPKVAQDWLDARIINGVDISCVGAWIERDGRGFRWKDGQIIGADGQWEGRGFGAQPACLWENGIWDGGPSTSWVSGDWMDGTWNDGVWGDYPSHWKRTTWFDGKFLGGSFGRPGAQGYAGMDNLRGGMAYRGDAPLAKRIEFGPGATFHRIDVALIPDEHFFGNLRFEQVKVPPGSDWASAGRRISVQSNDPVVWNGERMWFRFPEGHESYSLNGDPGEIRRFFLLFGRQA